MSTMAQAASQTAIVIVTYRRPTYMKLLLESIAGLELKPGHLVVVDNASGDETRQTVETARAALADCNLRYLALPTNTGGAGGFHAGIREALGFDAQWFWLMDDDVAVLPDGLEHLLSFAHRHRCIMGRRLDHRGRPYFFQTFFDTRLGIHVPRPGNVFAKGPVWLTNICSFEGAFLHRSIVDRIGLPDPRFFVTWDDVIYGWLASQIEPFAYVDRVVMKRLRPQRQIDLGIRHLSASSDLSRYYVMRNRGLVAQYLKAHGLHRPLLFGVGTGLTLLKELLRLITVDRTVSGLGQVFRGMTDARQLARQPDWRPMPPTT